MISIASISLAAEECLRRTKRTIPAAPDLPDTIDGGWFFRAIA